MFVQVLVILLHWIDTLVLKTEGNTYHRCATSPFPLRGNTNARLQGHGGILCIFSKEVPKGVAVAEGFLALLLRSIKTRIVSRQHAYVWHRWKVFCCSSRTIFGSVAGEGEIKFRSIQVGVTNSSLAFTFFASCLSFSTPPLHIFRFHLPFSFAVSFCLFSVFLCRFPFPFAVFLCQFSCLLVFLLVC